MTMVATDGNWRDRTGRIAFPIRTTQYQHHIQEVTIAIEIVCRLWLVPVRSIFLGASFTSAWVEKTDILEINRREWCYIHCKTRGNGMDRTKRPISTRIDRTKGPILTRMDRTKSSALTAGESFALKEGRASDAYVKPLAGIP